MTDHLVMLPIAVDRFPSQAFDVRWLEKKTAASSASSSSSSSSSAGPAQDCSWADASLDVDCDTPAARSMMVAARRARDTGHDGSAGAGNRMDDDDKNDDTDDDDDDFSLRGRTLFQLVHDKHILPAIKRALAQGPAASSSSSSATSLSPSAGAGAVGASASPLDNPAVVRELASIPTYGAIVEGLKKRFASASMLAGLQPYTRVRGAPVGMPLVPADKPLPSPSSSSSSVPASGDSISSSSSSPPLAILRVCVYSRDDTQQKHSRPLRTTQEFEVLSSTPLQALMDSIYCPNERITADILEKARQRRRHLAAASSSLPTCEAHPASTSSSSSSSPGSDTPALGSVCTCGLAPAYDGASCLYIEGVAYDDCRPAWRMKHAQQQEQGQGDVEESSAARGSKGSSSVTSPTASATATDKSLKTLLEMLKEEDEDEGERDAASGDKNDNDNTEEGDEAAGNDNGIEPMVLSPRPRLGLALAEYLNSHLEAGIATGWGHVKPLDMKGVTFGDLSVRLGGHYCFLHETPPSPWQLDEWRRVRATKNAKRNGQASSASLEPASAVEAVEGGPGDADGEHFVPTTFFYGHGNTCCEHILAFTDIRRYNPSASADGPLYEADTGLCRYPRLVSQAPYQYRMCCACGFSGAQLMVYGDPLAMENPAHYCGLCFDALHPGKLKRAPKAPTSSYSLSSSSSSSSSASSSSSSTALAADELRPLQGEPLPSHLSGAKVSVRDLIDHVERRHKAYVEAKTSAQDYELVIEAGQATGPGQQRFYWLPYTHDLLQTHLHHDHFKFPFHADQLGSRFLAANGRAAGGGSGGADDGEA